MEDKSSQGKFSVLSTTNQKELAMKCWQNFISHDVSHAFHMLTLLKIQVIAVAEPGQTDSEKTKKKSGEEL